MTPGHSLRFALLPNGEDPDSFIKSHGSNAIRELFINATALSEFIWKLETKGYTANTPEDRSWLELRLRDRAKGIKNETVRRYYLDDFKERLRQNFLTIKNYRNLKNSSPYQKHSQLKAKSGIGTQVNSKNLREAILIYTLISHPLLFEQVGEQIGTVMFSNRNLDKLRQEVLMALSSFEELGERLDSKSLENHLIHAGNSGLISEAVRRQVYNHASFSRPDEDLEVARVGWEQQFRIFKREQLLTEIQATKERLMTNLNREDFELLKTLKRSAVEIDESELLANDMVPEVKGTGT